MQHHFRRVTCTSVYMTKTALKPQNLLLFVPPFLATLAIVAAQSLPKPQQLVPKTGVLANLKHKVTR